MDTKLKVQERKKLKCFPPHPDPQRDLDKLKWVRRRMTRMKRGLFSSYCMVDFGVYLGKGDPKGHVRGLGRGHQMAAFRL